MASWDFRQLDEKANIIRRQERPAFCFPKVKSTGNNFEMILEMCKDFFAPVGYQASEEAIQKHFYDLE